MTLVTRAADAAGHPLARGPVGVDADWVCAAARRPGIDAQALATAVAAVDGVAGCDLRDGLLLVRAADDALLAEVLGTDVAAPVRVLPTAPDVPAAFAAATGGSPARFAARRLTNPAYAALVVRDRAARGLPLAWGREVLVDLVDLPRALAEHDAGRSHRLVEWVGRLAADALATPVAGPAADGAVPMDGRHRLPTALAARMGAALRSLGVPHVERI